MGKLKLREQFSSRPRHVRVKPCTQVGGHLCERVRAPAASRRGRFSPGCRSDLALFPGMAQPLEKLLDIHPVSDAGFGGRRCIGLRHQPRLRLPDVVEQGDRVKRLELRRERLLC